VTNYKEIELAAFVTGMAYNVRGILGRTRIMKKKPLPLVSIENMLTRPIPVDQSQPEKVAPKSAQRKKRTHDQMTSFDKQYLHAYHQTLTTQAELICRNWFVY
jgi:hypothetical protein